MAGRPKKEELDIVKWTFHLHGTMMNFNIKKIRVNKLIQLALCDSELISSGFVISKKEGALLANKAIEAIKDGKSNFLRYDNENDAIELKR